MTSFLRTATLQSRLVSLLLALSLSGGCAGRELSGHWYSPPTEGVPEDRAVLAPAPFAFVWEQLLARAQEDPFELVSAEAESGVVVVGFQSERPERYVSCGTTERSFRYGPESATYRYETAASSSFKTAGRLPEAGGRSATVAVNRKTHLLGRAYLFVTPVGDQTLVELNARYVLDLLVSGQFERRGTFGQVLESGFLQGRKLRTAFNSHAAGSRDWGSGSKRMEVTCRSRGVLEAELLRLVGASIRTDLRTVDGLAAPEEGTR